MYEANMFQKPTVWNPKVRKPENAHIWEAKTTEFVGIFA